MERTISPAPAETTTTATRSTPHGPRPVSRGQRNLLVRLATETGLTFEPPATFVQAMREIDRLKKAKRSHRGERRAEAKDLSRALAAGPANTVRYDEIDGYGSDARWGTGKRQRDEEGQARGDERCRAISAFPNPYYAGLEDANGKPISRMQAQRAYARMLWQRMNNQDSSITQELARLHGTLTGCCCRVHPCEREVLADAAAYAAGKAA